MRPSSSSRRPTPAGEPHHRPTMSVEEFTSWPVMIQAAGSGVPRHRSGTAHVLRGRGERLTANLIEHGKARRRLG